MSSTSSSSSSSTDIRAVIELVMQMKSSLDSAQTDCTRADQAVREGNQFAAGIHQLFPKLRFIATEVANQLEVMETLKGRISKRCQAAQTIFDTLSAETKETHQNLESIFIVLQQRSVDPEFDRDARLRNFVGKPSKTSSSVNISQQQQPQQQPPQEALTLFDFVDVDSVSKLRHETTLELQELKKVAEGCAAINAAVAERFQSFGTRFANARNGLNLNDSLIDEVLRMIATQNEKSEKMAESLIFMVNLDRLGEEQAKTKGKLDARAVEGWAIDLIHEGGIVKDSLEQLLKIRTSLERKQEQISSSFETHLKLFQEMDGHGIELAKCLASLADFETRLAKSKAGIEGNLTEFESLDAWYRQFHRAYNHLVLEIDRRCGYFDTEQRLIHDFMQTLEANMKEETEQRKEFWQHYGQFLPEALCPAIKEFPQKRQIFDNSSIKLPKFSDLVISRTKQIVQEEEED